MPGASERAMVAATVSASKSEKGWKTMAMPSVRASRGERMTTGSPLQRISPPLGARMPNSIFTSVDLPAPFSPSRAWISPDAISRSMPVQAAKSPKYFVSPRTEDRKSVVEGKSVSVRVDLGGRSHIKKKKIQQIKILKNK